METVFQNLLKNSEIERKRNFLLYSTSVRIKCNKAGNKFVTNSLSLKKIEMKNITIPIEIPSDLLIVLNESEQEIKSHFQATIALTLFKDGKLTIGKATQLSGLSRFEFEKLLAKNKIPVSGTTIKQIFDDAEKLQNL
jgi:predicted HTH domain antitoxin